MGICASQIKEDKNQESHLKIKHKTEKKSSLVDKKSSCFQDERNWAELHWAALYDDRNRMKELIKQGIDSNLKNKSGWSAKDIAYFYEKTQKSYRS